MKRARRSNANNNQQDTDQTKQLLLHKFVDVQPKNNNSEEPPPLPDPTDEEDNEYNIDENSEEDVVDESDSESDDDQDQTNKGSRKKVIIQQLNKLKGKFTYFTKKDSSGRSRGFLQCNSICPNGPCKGIQCKYTTRFSTKKKNYTHLHTYDLGAIYKQAPKPIQSTALTDTLVDIVSTTNMSFRKACSPQFTKLMDDCIEYGFNLGRKKKELEPKDKFPHISRNTLQKLSIEKSERIRDENLNKFATRDVYISMDGAKICHQQTVDVIVYGYSSDGTLESFLLDTYEPEEYSTEEFRKIGNDVIKTMRLYNCRVRAFVTDGLPAQRAAFDPTNQKSIQSTEGGELANIFYIYCRCHLINGVIEELVQSSNLMMKAKNHVRKIATYLRKRTNAKILGKLCPEPIEIRFCYDFKIVDFIVKNIDRLDDLHIPFFVFCYGVILEVLWDLYASLEKYDATIANTHLAILVTINKLRKTATMSNCVCLRNNCYRTIQILNEKFKPEKDLARTAFSLTKQGREFYKDVASNDGKELITLDSYEGEHQRIRNYFIFELAPLLFPSIETCQSIYSEHSFEASDQQKNEEEEEEEDFEYSMDDEMSIQCEEEEDEKIPIDEPESEKYDITQTGSKVIEKWATLEGFNAEEVQNIKEKYINWLSELSNRYAEEAAKNSNNSYIYWAYMATINGWPKFAKLASIISNIPASEVENERIFSIKRNIVGKHSVRSKPVTITARTRVIMRSKFINAK